MAILSKKPYEISLWEDVLCFQVFAAVQVDFNQVTYKKNSFYYLSTQSDGTSGSINQFILDSSEERVRGRSYYTLGRLLDEYYGGIQNKTYDTQVIVVQFFKEKKLCVIGSDTMDTPIRAVSSKLVTNVNGSNTLTFSIYSRYYDEETSSFYDNPFIKYLVNERKVKLRYGTLGATDCKWYDLVIKKIDEKSDNKTFTYTAKDIFINELSKTGFNIQLDPELENNMGSITQLAEVVLEDSDWSLRNENVLLQQLKEEPLYEVKLKLPITATGMTSGQSIDISAGTTIYTFYSVIENKETYFQFLYVPSGNYALDDDRVITNSENYVLNINYVDGLPSFALSVTISSEMRGKRLVRQQKTKYDASIDKYVTLYTKNDTTYYGFTSSDYISPNAVINYVSNPANFTSDSGWRGCGVLEDSKTLQPTIVIQGYPDLRDTAVEEIANTSFRSFLVYSATKEGQKLLNSGIADNRSTIEGFTKDEKYVFRVRFGQATLNQHGRPQSITPTSKEMEFKVATYTVAQGVYNIQDILFSGQVNPAGEYKFVQQIVACNKTISKNELMEARVGIFITLPINEVFYIENVEFFPYLTYEKDGEELMCIPGGEMIAVTKTKYYYYVPNEDYKSIEDLAPETWSYNPDPSYIPVYDESYEKIRSITASESNRFNLIQDLCEIFECWARFEIEHNPSTGEILYGKDKTWYDNEGNIIECPEAERYRQQKFISFQEYIGKDNFAGFRYGINLKSINRVLDSDAIVSKMIVKNNSNEFGKNGFCSIARANENPIGENFILDFSHYIQQGLVSFNEINNDLYLSVNGYLGYYKKLREINRDREARIESQAGLLVDSTKYEASYQTYKASVAEAEEDRQDTYNQIQDLTSWNLYDLILFEQHDFTIDRDWDDRLTTANAAEKLGAIGEERTSIVTEALDWWESNSLKNLVNKISQLNTIITQHTALRDTAKNNWDFAKEQYDQINEYLEELAHQKRALDLQFYKKYSRFIQEGSWINEDYVDDNLYFLDAENTLHNSAQPKVTYNISVLELSQIEGYEGYSFALGDKTYIEDTEFFGWVWQNGIKTPYHEEIIVSEITIELDSPEKNTIKVQNYKTQFEDLFQRITATTQSVEFHTGEYTRAAGIIDEDGTIPISILQNSMANNALRLENARDQSVVWDETGITTTCLTNPAEIVRIVSGGIFLSADGGATWQTGITGAGINANYITTGQLNVGRINIVNGSFTSFRWDDIGLSAYSFRLDDNLSPYGYNNARFVRFDQFGIYGMSNHPNYNPLVKENGRVGEEKIWKDASFALTWKGFLLRNSYGTGYVSINSEEDFVVHDGTNVRIKIGNLGEEQSPVYGIQIKDASGATVMESNEDGTLWLKNQLNVETYGNNKVAIGKLDTEATKDVTHGGRVMNANDKFVVYEDGHMKATGAEFEGHITATSGTIGNVTIGEVETAVESWEEISASAKKLDILSKKGYNFRVGENEITPQVIELEAKINNFQLTSIIWEGSSDFLNWSELAVGVENYNLDYNFFKQKELNGTYYIRATAISDEEKEYTDWTTITSVTDGINGEDALTLIITASNGSYFRNNQGNTTLTARIYKGGLEVDRYEPYEYSYTWTDVSAPNKVLSTNKTITVSAADVNFSRTYVCDIAKKEDN